MKEKLSILKGDINGALIASIIAFPQALAFGVASGMGASAGIWGAIILSFIAGILGCNLPIISGPTGPCTIILATIVASCSSNIGEIVTILFMSAIFQIIISLTKIPRMIKYVPYPVISGFLTGIGIIIILLQISPLLGGKNFSSTISALINYPNIFSNINIPTAIIGISTLAILFLTPKKISKIIPSQLIALILMTGVTYYFGLDIEKITGIEYSIPNAYSINFSYDIIFKNIPLALTLAFIATSESLLTGIIMDSLTKIRHNSKRLILSQGIGNLFCAITGSMYGTGATMRSVAAVKSGAKTRLASILCSFILIFVLLKLNNFISQIPVCVLAGILIKIGYDILDLKVIKVLKYAPKDDLYVLLTVLALTVFYNLIFALGVGIVLSSLLYAKRIADNTNIKENKFNPAPYTKYETDIEQKTNYKIRILHINGQFFFGSISQIVSHFDEMLETEYIILNYSSNTELDMSAIFALEDIIVRLQSQGIKLYLVMQNKNVYNQLKLLTIFSQTQEENLFLNEDTAIKQALNNTHMENLFN